MDKDKTFVSFIALKIQCDFTTAFTEGSIENY